MSRLSSSFMLLPLIVLAVVVNTKPEPWDPNTECPDGFWFNSINNGCTPLFHPKREALDAPMTHKTKRGSSSRSSSSSSSSSIKITSSKKGKREALDAPMTHKAKRGSSSSHSSSSSSSSSIKISSSRKTSSGRK